MRIERNVFKASDIARNETLFHVANGYLGVRACFEEGVPEGIPSIRGTYVNGYYDVKKVSYAERLYGFPEESECMVNAIDMQSIALKVAGEAFSLFSGEVLAFSQTLDCDKGVYTRAIRWRSPKGHRIALTIRRMASLVLPQLFLIEYTVCAPDGAVELEIRSEADADVRNFADPNDPRMSADAGRHLIASGVTPTPGGAILLARAPGSGLMLAAMMENRLSRDWARETTADAARARTVFRGTLPGGQSVTLTKYCVYTDQRRFPETETAARERLRDACARTFDAWARAQEEALAVFWTNARISIAGDEALERSLTYNLYSLYQSAGRDSMSNVAAKGLSGEGYEGHYFWDTEIYIFPFFLLTDLDRARNLLDFRYALLPAARRHARVMGHTQGALYPWRTIAGRECSSYFPSGSAQYHLSGDVAHSFLQYWYATDDLAYMAQKGWAVLSETARMWLTVGHFVDGRFHIDDVTGPDEYTCVVNNNYYTNRAAQENLLGAAELAEALLRAGYHPDADKDEIEAFRRAGENMYLPYDEELGICAQDDSFLRKAKLDLAAIPIENYPLLMHYHPLFLYRHQVLKQADTILAHALFDEDVPEDVIGRGYRYYEAITTHDSSLSACAYSIVAARLGDMEKAERYFRMTAELDLTDAHGNTKDGIHTASMGGAYLAVVAGFAGLRIRKDTLALRPRLPSGIAGYAFRFRYRNRLIELKVDRNGHTLDLLEGKTVTITVNDALVQIGGTKDA